MIEEAWVLRAKDYTENGESVYYGEEGPTTDLQEALIVVDKEEFLEDAKQHEVRTIERFGKNAICNGGYTNITNNYEFVEVEVSQK